MINKTALSILFFFVTKVMAQDTGQFEITKTNFKDLFNNYRFASPEIIPWSGSFFPYVNEGTAVKLNAKGEQVKRGRSPMDAYGYISARGNDPSIWEKQNHGCQQYEGELKKSCESWWGHCNGWAAAAIKEKEPRMSKIVGGQEVTIADQKGILTELWLSSYSLNAGLTDKAEKTKSWVHDHDNPSEKYQKFWDIKPKAFFLILTNYVGLLKTGIVIDRFTGSEVWNQPLVGYRFLPIRQEDISEIKDKGKVYWSVMLRVKIYWANDLGINPGHVSREFSISKMRDEEEVESLPEDYDGRFLSFKLFFDSEVLVSPDGEIVKNAGKMIGDGLWDHQENSHRYTLEELNHTHPDFLWIPTQAFQDQSGYGNPYMDSVIVQDLLHGRSISHHDRGPLKLKFIFNLDQFSSSSRTPEKIKRVVQSVIKREGIKNIISLSSVEINGSVIKILVEFPFRVDSVYLRKLFEAAGLPAKIEKI
jgi:hypothetical protein